MYVHYNLESDVGQVLYIQYLENVASCTCKCRMGRNPVSPQGPMGYWLVNLTA